MGALSGIIGSYPVSSSDGDPQRAAVEAQNRAQSSIYQQQVFGKWISQLQGTGNSIWEQQQMLGQWDASSPENSITEIEILLLKNQIDNFELR